MGVRVVVAEDDYLVREGVQRLLHDEPSVDFVAAYPDAASLQANLASDAPDVVITDIRMPPALEDEGLVLARELQSSSPETAVIVLSQVSAPEYAAAIFADGAERRAYLLKDSIADRAKLTRVIRDVAAGGTYVDPEVVVSLVGSREASPSPLDELSAREREVLALIAQGLSNQAIAERVHLTKRSVEGYIGSIFLKLSLPDEEHVSRRVAATLLFLAETTAHPE